MMRDFWTDGRIAGVLVLLSILIPLGAVAVVALRGDLRGVSAAFAGLEGIEDASGLRIVSGVWTGSLTLVAQIAGFAVLTVLLREAGDRALGTVALNLLLFSVVMAAIEGSFQGSVTAWAAEHRARTGSVPELYEPLRRWVNLAVGGAWVISFLIAMVVYGWAILRTGLLPAWVGWAAIGWDALWLVLVAFRFGIPAVIFGAPLVIGISLLVQG